MTTSRRARTRPARHWRETVLTSVMGAVTNVALTWMILASPTLSLHLGLASASWVTPMVGVELVRMALVAVIGLVMVRQRHGLEDRAQAARLAARFGVGTWALLTLVGVLAAAGDVSAWGTVTNLLTWVVGALLGAVFVAPGPPTREENVYLRRLDQDARG
ncbi:hypothetical protein [Georgenia sp. SYP-B2076]|uniref:hypothetical protein n=1 Tax=Georgenia sp. SYP-B2076 TaxID=2495881 RepID=UPI000F8CB72A|nr:hypothetical protein [Georgenia sp. SYP-B2076]